MASTTSTANVEFQKLNSILSLHTPAPTPNSLKTQNDPTTIVICQWLRVSPRSRTLQSIYTHYAAVYPEARILTIRSIPEFYLITPTSSRLALFKPLVSVLQSDTAPNPRLLIHLFSNGGALSLVDLCTVFKSETGYILPIQAIVLDSSPGYPNFRENWNAISMVLPKFPLFYYPSATLLAAILAFVWIRVNVFGLSMLANSTGRKINDVGLVDGKAKRLYVYSTIDALVGWRDVEKHVEEARRNEIEVTTLKEYTTKHVQHLVFDGERYWETIGKLWGSTLVSG
jgi:hypothetical protein